MTISRTKRFFSVTLIVAFALALGGCSTTDGSSTATDSDTSAEAAEANVWLPVPASSLLAQLELGMSETKVTNILGNPDDARGYPTGKNWIPFYFGGDTYRKELMFKGVGRVILSNTSKFSRNMIVSDRIHDPTQE